MFPLVALAAGAFTGFSNNLLNREEAKLANRASIVNTEAKNKVRQASNAATAAQGNLARWVQSVNNNRALDSGGDALEQLRVNSARAKDAALTQGFAESIRSAEALGAAAAQQAQAGVGGQVVDMVNMSVALRDAVVRQEFADKLVMQDYDTARRAGSIMSQVIGGLDNSILVDSLDYNQDVRTERYVKSHFSAALNGALGAMGGQQAATAGAPAGSQDYQIMTQQWNQNMQAMKSGWWNSNPQTQPNQIKFTWANQNDGISLSDQIGAQMTNDDYAKAWWSN